MPRYRQRRRRTKKNSLLGLWIGLGVLGGIILILLIVLLVTMGQKDGDKIASQPDSSGSGNGGLFGASVVDDGSPVIISNPQYFRYTRGKPLIRMNYEIKRPNELRFQDVTVQLESGKPGSMEGHLNVPILVSRSKLKDEGTVDLPMFDISKMPGGVRFPDGELVWKVGGHRVSNVLIVPIRADTGSFPIAPEITQIREQASRFRVDLRNPRYTSDFFPKMFVEIAPTVGQPDSSYNYVLVCEQKVLAGSFSHDEALTNDLLTRGGTVEVEPQTGFHANSIYELRVEARLPSDRNVATTISNTISMPGPRK